MTQQKKSFRCYASHSFIHCVDIVVVVILDFVFLYNSQSPKRRWGGRKEWTTTFLDGLGLAVMMAGGGREEEGEVQRKREPNNWGIIRVGPLLPYAAGKTQVSHTHWGFYGHTLGWYYFTYYLLCSWDWLMTWVAISFVYVCMCFFLSLSLSSFSTLHVVFLSFLLEFCTLFCVC
jgi:hypothetical protein